MVYIWLRTEVAWDDELAYPAHIVPALRQRVELWNETFNLPYHVFRQRLREIAELNHSNVEAAVRRRYEEIPNGELVLPVDDDDWFAPDAARLLEDRRDPEAQVYYWPPSFLEVPIDRVHAITRVGRRVLDRPKYTCATNSYAVVKEPGAMRLLDAHVQASRWVDSRRRQPSVKRIDQRLSVMNRTLASKTMLRRWRPSLRRAELLRKYRKYRALYTKRTGAELSWCRPYLAMMAELMSRLEPVEPRRISRGS